jgi:NOL1/NOP2/sun family putative RNA methylase
MASLPEKLLDSLEGIKGFNKNSFIQIHGSEERITSIRINPAKSPLSPFEVKSPAASRHPLFQRGTGGISEKIPWSNYGYYLPSRPFFTFDPLLHGGAYYVQEASSMFLEQCLLQTIDLSKEIKILDLCAAPGGKSTHIQSLINKQSLLVSNEVIKTRVNILIENVSKWGAVNNIVTNNDPRDFTRLENYFDAIIIDAPCSGSGLFRRDPDAIKEWSEGAVALCSHRQQRILSDAYPALKQNGILIYSTCSYSLAEDEEICDWICEHFKVEPLPVNINADWNIIETFSARNNSPAYRFFPDQLKGEGFFIACFRKKDGEPSFNNYPKKNKLSKLSVAEKEIVEPWLKNSSAYHLYHLDQDVFAFPEMMDMDLAVIHANLYTKKAGIRIGRLVNKELVPDHELALSEMVNDDLLSISLKKEEALQYLRKEEVKFETGNKGWALVKFEGVNLGWVKLLGNRINNYYPKEWRILKSRNS